MAKIHFLIKVTLGLILFLELMGPANSALPSDAVRKHSCDLPLSVKIGTMRTSTWAVGQIHESGEL